MPLLDSFEGSVIFSEPVQALHVDGLPDTHCVIIATPDDVTLRIYTLEGIPIGTKVRCDNIYSKAVRITRLS